MGVIPNVITHGLMALDVYNQLAVSPVQRAIKRNPEAYLLGSNGPDILFYFNVFPWEDQELNRMVTGFGEMVHTSKINTFFNTAVKRVLSIEDEERKQILIAYLAGHFQHWALDSRAHPFIFYRGGAIKGRTRYWHFRYESMLDALMVAYVKRRDMKSLNVGKFANVNEVQRRVIATFYSSLLYEIYDVYLEPMDIESSITSFKKAITILYDPHNLKTKAIQKLEKIIGESWQYSSHVVNGDLDAEHDILNLRHDEWANPTDQADRSTESFMDLYQASISVGLKVIEQMNDALNGSFESFDHLLEGRCYDTGRSEGIPMQYFDSIYEK